MAVWLRNAKAHLTSPGDNPMESGAGFLRAFYLELSPRPQQQRQHCCCHTCWCLRTEPSCSVTSRTTSLFHWVTFKFNSAVALKKTSGYTHTQISKVIITNGFSPSGSSFLSSCVHTWFQSFAASVATYSTAAAVVISCPHNLRNVTKAVFYTYINIKKRTKKLASY